MTENTELPYVREVDFAALASAGPTERISQKLLDATSGAKGFSVSYYQTPAGGGSPRGFHYHEFEQVFYILSGSMNFKILDEEFRVGPGGLVVIPARVAHQNWNESSEPVFHLNIESPVLAPGVERAIKISD